MLQAARVSMRLCCHQKSFQAYQSDYLSSSIVCDAHRLSRLILRQYQEVSTSWVEYIYGDFLFATYISFVSATTERPSKPNAATLFELVDGMAD